MKAIQCIIHPNKLDEVCHALVEAGIADFSVSDVREFSCQNAPSEHPLSQGKYIVGLWPQSKIEIAITDDLLDHVLPLILRLAKSWQVSDGLILIHQINQVAPARSND